MSRILIIEFKRISKARNMEKQVQYADDDKQLRSNRNEKSLGGKNRMW